MSPFALSDATFSLRFPSASGDEPSHDWPEVERFMFSPRERG